MLILTYDDGSAEHRHEEFTEDDYKEAEFMYSWAVACGLDNVTLKRDDGYLLEFHRG